MKSFLAVECCQGAGLDVALTAEDYRVTVDDLPCPVALLTQTMLTCHIYAYTYIGAHRAAVKVLHIQCLKSILFFHVFWLRPTFSVVFSCSHLPWLSDRNDTWPIEICATSSEEFVPKHVAE